MRGSLPVGPDLGAGGRNNPTRYTQGRLARRDPTRGPLPNAGALKPVGGALRLRLAFPAGPPLAVGPAVFGLLPGRLRALL